MQLVGHLVGCLEVGVGHEVVRAWDRARTAGQKMDVVDGGSPIVVGDGGLMSVVVVENEGSSRRNGRRVARPTSSGDASVDVGNVHVEVACYGRLLLPRRACRKAVVPRVASCLLRSCCRTTATSCCRHFVFEVEGGMLLAAVVIFETLGHEVEAAFRFAYTTSVRWIIGALGKGPESRRRHLHKANRKVAKSS